MKNNRNGKVVIYTEQGGAIVTADVAIRSEIQPGAVSPDFYKNSLDVPKNCKYALVGLTKTKLQDKHGAPLKETAFKPAPFIIDEALNYTKTKFFRLIIDLMKLAQFDPFDGGKAFDTDRFNTFGAGFLPPPSDVDYSLSIKEIDQQLYRKYDFTPAMIAFVEERYGDLE